LDVQPTSIARRVPNKERPSQARLPFAPVIAALIACAPRIHVFFREDVALARIPDAQGYPIFILV
jgi:hypothetical protein